MQEEIVFNLYYHRLFNLPKVAKLVEAPTPIFKLPSSSPKKLQIVNNNNKQ